MNALFWAFILSLSPFGELRLSIPVGLATGGNVFIVFLFAVIGNILVIPLALFFLDFIHEHLYKISIYRRLFNHYLNKVRKKIEPKLGEWKYLVLLLFIAIPLPGTGAYSSSLAAWFFEFDRKKSFLVISLGVLIAGFIVTVISLGLLNGINYLF